MTSQRQLMYLVSMASEWFGFLEHLHPTPDMELTTLVTPRLEEIPNSPLRLDWLVHMGGQKRAHIESMIRESPNVPRLLAAMKPDAVVDFETDAWLKDHPGWELERIDSNPVADTDAWYRMLQLPVELKNHVPEFLSDMQSAQVDLHSPPWLLWSRFPPWLQRRGLKERAVFRADERLTFLRTALSPQDELGERESLAEQTVMLNPTFDYIDGLDGKAPLVGFTRQWDSVTKRALTVLEAAILDQARESFRIERCELLRLVSMEMRVQKEFVGIAIESLIGDYFLLGKSNGKSPLIDQ